MEPGVPANSDFMIPGRHRFSGWPTVSIRSPVFAAGNSDKIEEWNKWGGVIITKSNDQRAGNLAGGDLVRGPDLVVPSGTGCARGGVRDSEIFGLTTSEEMLSAVA